MRCGKVAIKQCLIEHGKGVRKAFCVRLFSGGGQGGGGPEEKGAGEGRKQEQHGVGSRIHVRVKSRSRNKEGDSLLFITGYYSVKNTSLAKF